jgi:hypothetical protein
MRLRILILFDANADADPGYQNDVDPCVLLLEGTFTSFFKDISHK